MKFCVCSGSATDGRSLEAEAGEPVSKGQTSSTGTTATVCLDGICCFVMKFLAILKSDVSTSAPLSSEPLWSSPILPNLSECCCWGVTIALEDTL